MTAEVEVDLATRLENPYWDIVKRLPGDEISMKYEKRWQPATFPRISMLDEPDGAAKYEEYAENGPTRHNLVKKYSWAIPSPETIGWLVGILNGRKVVEMGAGTGYWAWLLHQSGIDVNAYDIAPVHEGHNSYHSEREEFVHEYTEEEHQQHWERHQSFLTMTQSVNELSEAMGSVPMPPHPPFCCLPRFGLRTRPAGKPGHEWFPVEQGGVEVLARPENQTRILFLSWPPYDDDMGYQCLSAYQGDTLVLIGEPDGGCTGDDKMFELLGAEWELIETGPLIQWWGLHDYIELYARKP